MVTLGAWLTEFLFLGLLNVERGEVPPAVDWTSPASVFAPHFVSIQKGDNFTDLQRRSRTGCFLASSMPTGRGLPSGWWRRCECDFTLMLVVGSDALFRTNDPRILARYSGVAKAGCSAGMAISFGVDGAGAAYLTEAIWQVSGPILTGHVIG